MGIRRNPYGYLASVRQLCLHLCLNMLLGSSDSIHRRTKYAPPDVRCKKRRLYPPPPYCPLIMTNLPMVPPIPSQVPTTSVISGPTGSNVSVEDSKQSLPTDNPIVTSPSAATQLHILPVPMGNTCTSTGDPTGGSRSSPVVEVSSVIEPYVGPTINIAVYAFAGEIRITPVVLWYLIHPSPCPIRIGSHVQLLDPFHTQRGIQSTVTGITGMTKRWVTFMLAPCVVGGTRMQTLSVPIEFATLPFAYKISRAILAVSRWLVDGPEEFAPPEEDTHQELMAGNSPECAYPRVPAPTL